MAGANVQNGGTQTAVKGKCPEGFVHVFGPLCVEQTRLAKFEENMPDLSKFEFTNPGCEAALAALNEAINAVEWALEMPRKIKALIQEIIEMPFDALQDMVDNVLGILDEIGNLIDDLLSGPGALIGEFISALEGLLACPFIADTPVGKTAAEILDAIEGGLPYRQLLSAFKRQCSAAVGDVLNKIEDAPLSRLEDLENMYNEMIQKSGVEELLKKARDLEQCLRAACNMAEVAARVPDEVSKILEGIGGKWDTATGKLQTIALEPVSENAKRAVKLYEDIRIIRLGGKG